MRAYCWSECIKDVIMGLEKRHCHLDIEERKFNMSMLESSAKVKMAAKQ